MKKLRVKFWQNENVVMMKILEQDESLRNKGKIFKSNDLDMTIYSTRFPTIIFDGIFIKGDIKEKDNIVSSITFNSTEDATVYIEKCQELISDYNNTILEEEEEVEEVVKTFTFE